MPLSEKQKYEIVILSEHGQTNKYISKKLNINRHTVERWINRYKANNNVKRIIGSGRKKKTSIHEDNIIFDTIKTNRLLTAKHICEKVKNNNISVCTKTIINRFHDFGMVYDYPKKKPLLTEEQMKNRLKWAVNHIDFDWNNVGFNDESCIQIGLSEKKDGYLMRTIMKK